jgi:hypothetical protein
MGKVFKILLSIATGLAVSSLLISTTSRVNFHTAFIYCFLMLLLFGWWAYLPFAALYYLFMHYVSRNSWLLSVGIGSVLATLLIVGLITIPEFPVYTRSRILDVLFFGVGGGVYGLLYYHWIANKQLHPKAL